MSESPEPSLAELRSTISDDLRRRSWPLGIGVAVGCCTLWGLTLTGLLRASSVTMLLCIGALHGVAIAICFVAGHDAVHGVLVPSRTGNALLGRLLLLPGWHPASSWVHSHNVLHHGYTNLRGRDPVYPPFSPRDFRTLPAWRRGAERLFRTPVGAGLFYACTVWWPCEIAPTGKHLTGAKRSGPFVLDRALVIGFAAAVVCLQITLGDQLAGISDPLEATLLRAALGTIWPFSVWMWLMGIVTYQQHTHPSTYWFDDRREWTIARSQLSGTVEQEWGGILDVAFLEIGRHHAHHVDTRVPLYRLRRAQRALRRQHGSLMPLLRLRWSEYVALWRHCHLYDYDTHQWCRFDGRTSTPARTLPFALLREREL
jgi:acyl-lipid omega-6 desaturase (Delta-12 desaturase)